VRRDALSKLRLLLRVQAVLLLRTLNTEHHAHAAPLDLVDVEAWNRLQPESANPDEPERQVSEPADGGESQRRGPDAP
jgi:hypothetical protein